MGQSVSSVQLLSSVRLFATPWIAARQASLSITSSWSSLRLTSIESVMPSSHLILCPPFSRDSNIMSISNYLLSAPTPLSFLTIRFLFAVCTVIIPLLSVLVTLFTKSHFMSVESVSLSVLRTIHRAMYIVHLYVITIWRLDEWMNM